jgi:hypothetical protein
MTLVVLTGVFRLLIRLIIASLKCTKRRSFVNIVLRLVSFVLSFVSPASLKSLQSRAIAVLADAPEVISSENSRISIAR